MKILLINTYDRGGAANACIRLHEGLLAVGVDSTLLVLHRTKDIPQSHQFRSHKKKPNPSTFSRILKKVDILFGSIIKKKLTPVQKFVSQREEDLDMFSNYFSNYDITESELYKQADVVNLHWVAGFLDYNSFFAKNKKPIVWTLHDMHPFSNGPHYEEWYSRMNDDGRPSKRLLSKEENYWIQKLKVENTSIFNKTENITIVTPSKWLGTASQNSLLFSKYDHKHIPYSLNQRVFKNLNKEVCRKILDIPLDKKVALFVAEYFVKRRKGYEYMDYAVKELKDDDILLCTVGALNNNLEKYNIRHLGIINDDRMLAVIYNAVDVFVIPSLMDNLPNTVLESLMCGTPVIGFDIGGIPDMIIHKQNGLIVDGISAQKLAESIRLFFKNQEKYDSKKINQKAKELYGSAVQAGRYKNLYKSLAEK